MDHWARPEVLRKIREEVGLTPDAVQEESRGRIRPPDLLAWEEGLSEPSLEDLEILSDVYECPVGYFFLEKPPEKALPLGFRGLAPAKEEKALSPPTKRALRRFVQTAEWVVRLIRENSVSWEIRLPLYEFTDYEAIREAAERERKAFGFHSGIREGWSNYRDAFEWWRRVVEDRGVFCLEMALDPKEVRGASLWVEGYPFILVNHQDAEADTGRLFTLLHEYAHLILRRPEEEGESTVCDFQGREEELGKRWEGPANRFAALLLLPKEEFRVHLASEGLGYRDSWPDAQLDRLRRPFFVSKDVVAVALEEMGLAPQGFYREKGREWEQKYKGWHPWGRGRRPTKKEQKARELGTSTLRLLIRLNSRGALSPLELAHFLDTKVERLPVFFEEFEWTLQRPG